MKYKNKQWLIENYFNKNRTPKTIERLHKEVTPKLKSHSDYDKLDYKD